MRPDTRTGNAWMIGQHDNRELGIEKADDIVRNWLRLHNGVAGARRTVGRLGDIRRTLDCMSRGCAESTRGTSMSTRERAGDSDGCCRFTLESGNCFAENVPLKLGLVGWSVSIWVPIVERRQAKSTSSECGFSGLNSGSFGSTKR
jgi:hypothetical protein